MRTFAFLLLALGGCSYTFDGTAADIPLVGDAPNMSSFPKLNKTPAGAALLVRGVDGAYWTVFRETIDIDGAPRKALRSVRLSDPPDEEILYADEISITWNAYYEFDAVAEPMPHKRLRIHGAGGARDEFELPPGDGFFMSGGEEDVFLYWKTAPETTDFLIQRRDRSFMRRLPIPDGVDPKEPTARARYDFFDSGHWLLIRDAKGKVSKHSTISEADRDIGMVPGNFAISWKNDALLTWGKDGLQKIPLNGSDRITLDPLPVDGSQGIVPYSYYANPRLRDRGEGQSVGERVDEVWYFRSDGMWAVSLDGGTPRPLLSVDKHPLLFGDPILYSYEPEDRWAQGASEGWLGDWRFMDRGRNPSFSRDRQKLRWLEHAARSGGIGDLLSAQVPRGEPLRLALNVRQYSELEDGRLLANSNRAFKGTQNRVIVIDEQRREARWVADAVAEYTKIPGRDELLVDVVSGPTGYDIVRVPIPPKLCPCPISFYCDTAAGHCKPGCASDDQCAKGTAGGYCDVAKHSCVSGCRDEHDCPVGNRCDGATSRCAPGLSP